MHMKKTCAPTSRDVKMVTPRRAEEPAAGIGAEMAERIGSRKSTGSTGVGVARRCGPLSGVPRSAAEGRRQGGPAEARIAPQVPAQALRRA